jgi:hypothetical protein
LAADATVISGASSAFDATVVLQIPALSVDVDEGPVTSLSGVAPPPYSLSASETTGFSHNGVVFDAALTATFSSAVSSDVDGAAGTRTTDAEGGIEDVTITFTAFSTEILRVEISQIIGSASVTGDFGSLSASGSTAPIDVTVMVAGWSPWVYSLTPTPNQQLVDNGVVRIVGNEQIVTCAGPVGGSDTCQIEVNALHVYIDGMVNGFYTQGEAVVGHAFAMMTAVPEPGTLVLLAFGLALSAAARRRGTIGG